MFILVMYELGWHAEERLNTHLRFVDHIDIGIGRRIALFVVPTGHKIFGALGPPRIQVRVPVFLRPFIQAGFGLVALFPCLALALGLLPLILGFGRIGLSPFALGSLGLGRRCDVEFLLRRRRRTEMPGLKHINRRVAVAGIPFINIL
jgi:hypothetical protein